MKKDPCPCNSSLAYEDCCKVFHQDLAYPTDPEKLMRSRYSAYALGLFDYAQKTWHTSTCPTDFEGSEPIKWLGLKVNKVFQDPTTEEFFVEFVARYKDPQQHGRASKIHELSRFIYEDGKLVYIDGVFPS